jgi:N-acetylmuramoyl-L-alanine amidase
MGFISNPDDAKKLVDPEWQAKFAEAVAAGTDEYLKNKE